MAASASLLALGGSGAALATAGTCTYDSPSNTETCSGDFTTGVPTIAPVDDMTLVTSAGSTIAPPAGVTAIDANDPAWGGDVTVVNNADITTSTYIAAQVYGSGTATFKNYGDIENSYNYGSFSDAAQVEAHGDVTIVNGGTLADQAIGGDNAYGIFAASTTGDVTLTNQVGGTISAYSVFGSAYGVDVYNSTTNTSGQGDISITNDGSVSASSGAGGGGRDAYAVRATNLYNGDIVITNNGEVAASVHGFYGSNAAGVDAHAQYGDVSLTNSADGSVYAYSRFGKATGMRAYSDIGSAAIINAGSIEAHSLDGRAFGVMAASHDGYATVSNLASGVISAISLYDAYAVYASNESGDVSVSNSGSISADGGDNANGVYATSTLGKVTVSNLAGGSITATSEDGEAYGVYATSVSGSVTVTNAGSITATAGGGEDPQGVHAYSYDGPVSVNNSGSITATGVGETYGVYAGSYKGDVTVTNFVGGSITATSYFGSATGVYAHSTNGDVTVSNAGLISSTSDYGAAIGVLTQTPGYHGGTAGVTVSNAGAISASGYSNSVGVDAASLYGDVAVTDVGTGSSVSASTAHGSAAGVDAASRYGNVTVSNAGAISANGYFGSFGVEATSDYGSVTVTNAGAISSSSHFGSVGVEATSDYGDVTVTDVGTGSSVSASSAHGSATGVVAGSRYGNVTVSNAGSISAYAYHDATGVQAESSYGDVSVSNLAGGSITAVATATDAGGVIGVTAYSHYGSVSVDNAGTITATANGGFTIGVEAIGYGDATVTNSGPIAASTQYGDAFGVIAVSYHGDATVTNTATGSISAISYLQGDAIGVEAIGYGDVTVTNAGAITATANGGNATGVYAGSHNGDVSVTNTATGSISAASSDEDAYGVFAKSTNGSLSVSNAAGGSISATTHGDAGNAYGVYATVEYGNVSVSNAGAIVAISDAENDNDDANGIVAFSQYDDVSVDNSGAITASASQGDSAGVIASSGGAASVTNSGQITVSTQNGHAIGVIADGGFTGDVSVANAATGSIVATAYLEGDAIGVRAKSYGYTSGVIVTNAGAITATATDGDSNGVYASGFYYAGSHFGDVSVTNSGSITATAISDLDAGEAVAIGLIARGYDTSVVTSAGGAISATASAYDADATGVSAIGYGSLELVNGSDIHAKATGTYGYAVGLFGENRYDGPNTTTASNSGNITAEFDGPNGHAYGAWIESDYGDVAFTNSGHITATTVGSAYHSVGVYLEAGAGHDTTLYNSGTITADIAVKSGASDDTIFNTGTLNGAIVTGDGNDTLNNQAGGVWNVSGALTDFGAGDDSIYNAGTIHMTDATIDMGSYVDGNHFENTGLITVSGASNYIFMDNPYPFVNNGTISFQDGHPDDVLTIGGDFAGQGNLNVDVSGLHGTSDQLYVDGNVAAGTSNAINVNLLDLPTTASTTIPVVAVSGDSVAGNFKLGTVNYDPVNFLALDFGVVSHIDASNATPDVFSLSTTVAGLSDRGAIAASITSGVQSLMSSEVGTWRQRMGVIDRFDRSGASTWIRVFGDSGKIDPDHVAANFGQGGNFRFDEHNSGVEAGIDFAFDEQFSLGLLLGKAEGRQRLDSPGVGSSKATGETWGVYGTWIAPSGFYLDTSYRRMHFNAQLGGESQQLGGDAESWNFEAGYAWKLANDAKLEPQFQYTHTSVSSLDPLNAPLATFRALGGDSSRARLGLSLRKSYGDAQSGAEWTPYATLSAVRESDGRSKYSINNVFFGQTGTQGTSALLEAGVNLRTGNLSFYGGLNWQDGGAVNSVFGGQVGLHYSF